MMIRCLTRGAAARRGHSSTPSHTHSHRQPSQLGNNCRGCGGCSVLELWGGRGCRNLRASSSTSCCRLYELPHRGAAAVVFLALLRAHWSGGGDATIKRPASGAESATRTLYTGFHPDHRLTWQCFQRLSASSSSSSSPSAGESPSVTSL